MIDYYKTTGLIPPMGMASSGLRTAFWKAVGQQGNNLVSDAAANKAGLASAQSALRTQQTQYSATKTSLNTLDKQLDLLAQYNNKIDKTGSPILNKYLLYLKGQYAGDADTAALQNIVQTASNEFAKILSGSAGS